MTARQPQPPAPRRVLIVKPSSLGDVVSAVPVLRGLRRTFACPLGPAGRRGEIHVAWLLAEGCAGLLAHDSDLDECVLFERRRLGRAWRSPEALVALASLLGRLRRGRYDWVIDLQGLLRSGLLTRATRAPLRAGFADAREGATRFYTHRIDVAERHTVARNVALARRLGIDARLEDMTLEVSAEGRAFAERAAAEHGLRDGYFVCVPPARRANKRYPVRHWRSVVRRLTRRAPVALLGAPGERDLCTAVAEGLAPGAVNLAGLTGVAEMVGVIAASSGVICGDSAAQFVAPAVGVPVVTLIGPTRVERTGPILTGRAIVADVPCQGCLRRRCGHITCMESIRPADVVAAAEDCFPLRHARCPTVT